MTPNGLGHAVNGWLGRTFGTPSPVAGARQVTVKSSIGLPRSLYVATTSLSRSTTSALQKKLRQAGFKGAVVEPLLRGDGGGFTVQYQGREYKFWIEESPSTEHYESNPMLKDSDKRVVRAFVNEKPDSSNLLDTDGVRLDKMGLGGETVAKWVGGRIAIVSTESAKSDETIIRLISKIAGPGVVDFSYARKGHRVHEHGAMGRNGKGIYHGTDAAANDIVIHKDHRGRFRIDRVTSRGGNHQDITGPSAGYPTAADAATAAHKAQYTRGDKTGMLLIADADGNLSAYDEHFASNGRRKNPEDIDRDFSGTDQASEHPETEAHFEHGQWWVTCLCGASWSVVDTSRGLDYERIDEGDEGYHDDMERNGRASTVDEHAARELSLYIENEYALIGKATSIGKSIDANLRKKVASGRYDAALAPKAWQYLIDEGAKRYVKALGSRDDGLGSSTMFSAATRRQVAEEFARAWEQENLHAANASKKTIRYVHVGDVERYVPSKRSYVWQTGYSEDGNTQPWVTKREAQAAASARGARAVFEEP
jgi:hypothetical protein